MAPAESVLDAVERLGTKTWSGRLYRHTSPGRDALSGEGARMAGGRWNPAASFPTIYFAESVDACVAEFRRMADLQGLPSAGFLPRSLHVVVARDLELLDLAPEGAIRAVGLRLEDLRADERAACQAIGEAAFFLGRQGIRAPSATAAGVVVAVFVPHVRTGQLELVETGPLPA